jgi:uncharacterized RDD family membrane protein YckC
VAASASAARWRRLAAGPAARDPFLALDLASLFSTDRRTLHDRLADTWVFLYPTPESG